MPQIKTSQELATQIEQLISDFIVAHRQAASAAVERAFAGAAPPPSRARKSAVAPRKYPFRRSRSLLRLTSKSAHAILAG